MSWLEAAIIAFIVIGIGWTVLRTGQANPEGTGELSRRVGSLSGTVSTLSNRVGHVEDDIRELKQEAATSKDIARLEERIETVRAEMAGHQQLSAATNRAVERIEDILLKGER